MAAHGLVRLGDEQDGFRPMFDQVADGGDGDVAGGYEDEFHEKVASAE